MPERIMFQCLRNARLSGHEHKYDGVCCAQFGLWRGARRAHPPAAATDENEATGQIRRNPKGGRSFWRRLRCSLLTDRWRVCSSLTPRLRQKSLSANVIVFMFMTTKGRFKKGARTPRQTPRTRAPSAVFKKTRGRGVRAPALLNRPPARLAYLRIFLTIASGNPILLRNEAVDFRLRSGAKGGARFDPGRGGGKADWGLENCAWGRAPGVRFWQRRERGECFSFCDG